MYNKLAARVKHELFGEQIKYEERLLHEFAIIGMAMAMLTASISVFYAGFSYVTAIELLVAPILCALLIFARVSRRYELSCMLAVIIIFGALYGIVFFKISGYLGGTTSYFIIAIVFSQLIISGRKAVVIMVLEAVFYAGLCVYQFTHPGSVRRLPELFELINTMASFLVSGCFIGVVASHYFASSARQRDELQKANEEAQILSQSKTNFLASMSHEIRTPINVMLGMNEMILRENENEQITGYAVNVKNAGKTLLTLINNVLDIAKVESGKFEVFEEPYMTMDLIRELSVIGLERSDSKALKFLARTDEDLPQALLGDVLHIKQVIINFLSNAVKYTEKGDITLSLGLKKTEKDDVILLCASVSDTGCGIEPENLTGMFDAFARVNYGSNRYIEGTGLGLDIAKRLTELMGGRISVESEVGRGSVFSVEIPQKVLSFDPIRKLRESAKGAAERYDNGFIAPGAKVLVVDDNFENLMVIKSLLKKTVMQVDTAQSGMECLDAAKNEHYHAILMDYIMPDMDGVETFLRLKSEIAGFDVPVIALTADTVAGVRQTLLNCGFARFLTKPVMWRELDEALIACLPPALLSRSAPANDGRLIDEDVKNKLCQELRVFDISLDDGLKYVGGDVEQYLEIVELFIENYDSSKRQIQELYSRGDWRSLKYPVHSLKSKSRNVGAICLSEVSGRIERRCENGDAELIQCEMAVLSLEWERAQAGLTILISQLKNLPLAEPKSKIRGGELDIDKLMKNIQLLRRRESEEMLASAAYSDHDRAFPRSAIKECLDELDFDGAERVLSEYVSARNVG